MKSEEQGMREPQPDKKSASYNEAKVLLVLIAAVLIVVIGGTVFLNAGGDNGAREEAIHEAFLHSKSRMLRQEDSLLADAVELHAMKEVHRGRETIHYKVEISMPDLQQVYDTYFEEMIRQKVWTEEDISESLQRIYLQAVERAEKAVYPLEEELLLSKEDRRYRVRNPEIFQMILPENPTEGLAGDFVRVMEVMNQPLELKPEGAVEPIWNEVITNLLAQDFFNQVTFGWNREGTQYHLTAIVNEITELSQVGSIEAFRPYRRKITDHPSLVETIEQVLKEKISAERTIRTLELRALKRPGEKDWGYRLVTRGGSGTYLRNMMEGAQNFFQRNYLSFHLLENLYRTAYPTDEEPWPKPLFTGDYQEPQVMARITTGEERRKLILEGKELWYRIYDSKTLKVLEEILIEEEVNREDVLTEEGMPNWWNEIRSQKDYDLIFYGDGRKHSYRVKRTAEGLGKSRLSRAYGDFSREEFYELQGRLYHIGHSGLGKDQTVKELQITDAEKGEIVYSRDQEALKDGYDYLNGTYFVNEQENLILIHYRGREDLLAKKLDQNLQFFYGTDHGLNVHPGLSEEIQQAGRIKNYQIVDQNRVFIENYQEDQWVVDFRKKTLIPVPPSEFDAAYRQAFLQEQFQDLAEEHPEMLGDMLDMYGGHHYRFTPLGEDLFFVEGFFPGDGGAMIFQREIWEVNDKVSVKVSLRIESDEGTLQYAYQDGMLIWSRENQLTVLEPDRSRLKNIAAKEELSLKDLDSHPAFSVLDSYRVPEELRKKTDLYLYGNYQFFTPNLRYRYDRERGNLYYSREGIADQSYTTVLMREEMEQLLPLWDYQELRLDSDFKTLYYRDHNGARIYDVNAFLKSLEKVSNDQKDE